MPVEPDNSSLRSGRSRRTAARVNRPHDLLCGLLVAVAAALLVAVSAPASAATSVYTIAKYPVQGQEKNAVEAKKKAMEDGQTAALRSLLKRIVPVTAYARIEAVKSTPASELIDGLSVRSEQNSSTEYYALLDFMFSPDAIRSMLKSNGVPFIDTQAGVTKLVPISVTAPGRPVAGLGDWGKTWASLDVDNSLAPLEIEAAPGGLPGGLQAALQGDDPGEATALLAGAFGGQQVLAAFAEVDRPSKRLNVTLAGRDAVGAFTLRRSYRVPDGDVAYAMELAAVVSLGILEGRWKAVQARAMGGLDAISGPGSAVRIEVLFENAREWYGLQQRLAELPGASNFQVELVSPRSAEVSLVYPGGVGPLASVLAREGLSLTAGGDRWLLRQSF